MSDTTQYLNGVLVNTLFNMLAKKTITPTEYHEQVHSVNNMLSNDITGIVDTLTDFAVSSANVDYDIETDNQELTTILKEWLKNINIGFNGKIPSGVQSLAEEYFKERWKSSSFPVLRLSGWKYFKNNLYLPTKMYFVNGASIYAKEKDDKETIGLIGWDYYVGSGYEEKYKLDENCIFDKPYSRWFDKYPVPYLIKKGIYHNWQIITNIKEKETEILDQIIPYLMLVKKGSEQIELQQEKSYSDEDLKAVIGQIQDLVDKNTDNSNKKKTNIRATNYDEEIKHFIPDLRSIFDKELFVVAERNILAGLGFIDVIEAVSTSRRESILNPKAFISDINKGIKDFKRLIKESVIMIMKKNESEHRKYTNQKFRVISSPVPEFMTEKFQDRIRALWDRGLVSSKTAIDLLGEGIDFETEVTRRDKEAKDGIDSIFYPHLTDNREDAGIDLKETTTKEGDTETDEENIPDDKKGIEAENYDMSTSYKCECVKCGHSITSNSHCKDLKCPKCGSIMRRENRPGTGNPNNSQLEGAPYKTVKDLPKNISKNLSLDLQRVYIRVFNTALNTYENETRAFRVAWSVIKKIGRKNKKSVWIRKKKREEGKLQPIRLNKAMMQEVLDKEEKEIIKETIEEKDLEIKLKQDKLLDKLLGNKE